jgi:hypothetical protein
MIIARQSTARTVTVGPVLDADGVAVTDGVVADLKIAKNGGAPAALNGSATLTHRHTGYYSLALTASDLDTVGQAEVVMDDTVNAMPIKELTVVEEAVYDITFAASATGAVPVASIASGAITAAAIATDAIDADALAADAIAEINATVDTALADYDGPTNAEMVARTLAAASYATATALQTVDDEIATIDGNVDLVLADTNELQTDWVNGGRLDLILDARASQTSVDDLPTNAELATSQAAADDATLAAIAALNNLSAAQVNAEVDTALADIHLDHLFQTTYDPASKPGAADALLNELIENDGGVARFTANALEQAPSGTGASASAIADEVQTRTIAAVTTVNGLAANVVTAAALAADAVAEIQSGLALEATAQSILTDTAEIGTAGAGLTNINLPNQTMDIVGNITGNLSGSVGSVTGAVGSVTGAVGSVTGAVGSVTGNVGGNVTGSVGSLAAQAKLDVNAEADTAISDAALATAANLALVKAVTDALTSAAATKLAASSLGIIRGTVDTTVAPSTTEFECDDITEATADHYIGRIVTFTSGVLLGQSTDITDYALAGGKGHFTVTALTEAPGNNDTLVIT